VPDVLDELQALAHAAQVPWRQVAALALLDESWALTGGMACTAIAITRPGVRVAGQNMDLPLWTDTLQTVLNVRDADGLGVVAATYPGSPATCGVNSNGVVVLVNALDLAVDLSGTPVSFIVRGALHCPSAGDAIAFIRSVPHAVGQTYTVMDAKDLYMVEAAADGVLDVPLHREVSLHTNHAFTREHPVTESSLTRYQAVEQQRAALVDRDALVVALRDQNTGVCQWRGRFTPDMYSFMGIVGDALARRAWVNGAPADDGGFTEVEFLTGL
jgi:predicted choloylglycine hydrolase